MAIHVGARAYHIHYFKKRRMLLAPIKYILASFKTLLVLYKERPDIIFVMNPPVFAVLIVWLYCRVNKSKYVVDTHSGIFTAARWRFFLPLYRFLAKQALMNMLHNKPQADEVAGWGAPSMVLEPGPIQTTTDRTYPFRPGYNVVIISTYDEDEPVLEVIEAARQLPDINFYITGSLQRAPRDILKHTPANVLLTDFLAREDFLALLKGSDVAVCLTTANNTHQWGALEAMEFARPIITSDWPVLRNYFSKGTVHVDNTASSLVVAIQQIRSDHSSYLKGIENLRKEQRANWDARFSKLIGLLERV
jgi:glycosyltransferase involved in cell wall biosynthesis